MLILADLSGIQDYLFEVREVGGRQARALRFRSLYIQLVAEAVRVRLLRAVGLNDNRPPLFCSAGKVAIDAGRLTAGQTAALHEEARRIESWLRDRTHGRLRLSVAIGDSPDTGAESYHAASRSLQAAKLRSWSGLACTDRSWQPDVLLTGVLSDPDAEAERDATFGREVTDSAHRHVVFGEEGSGAGFDVAGLSATLAATAGGQPHVDLARLARHIPTDSGQAIEFVDLAERARGAPMLGVLKADADSLGQAIGRRLAGAHDLEPLRAFSWELEDFFARTLDQEMRQGDARWSNLYTVFSGGDDVLLVGPWDIALDFAGHLQRLFARQFARDRLTISAGIALIKPRFPIRLAARQAEDLLHTAKAEKAPRADDPKDQCSALGQLWKWRDHEAIIGAGKRLANWVEAGAIRRGWLHTLLELAVLRRGERPGRDPGMPPVMATSRLAYHVGRNWPKPGDRDPHKRAARRWIDGVTAEFDGFEGTSHLDTIYLPAIVRYAMLATRGADRGEAR